jgi:methylmalonyl-CoA carboxyltransferase small subunit
LKLKITVDGKVYEVEVEAYEPEPVADESKVCRSPIAGTVARVPVQVGQAIHVNDVLIVLEAMKMETVITAPIAGKVAKINTKVGDFVQGGQVLVEFE